uniref:Zinc finger protein 280D n=1 Tax=Amphiprion percula TaxID=161767 RepID=A0A3P8T0J4_AMPPE
MSELFMECVEEELEPWQKQAPEVHLIDDDDDEPIFVGCFKCEDKCFDVLAANNQKDGKPNPPPPQRNAVAKTETKRPTVQPAVGPSPIVLPLSIPGNAVNAAPPTLTTVTPQPVIVNNQGFIVTSPQLANNSEFIASLGTQYPPGHRLPSYQVNLIAPAKVIVRVENGIIKKKCPNCQEEIISEEAMKYHLMVSKSFCSANVGSTSPSPQNTNANKRIMLVSDFYYGRFEGDMHKKEAQKTNTTFKCQSCLKVLKNNIRFMNHMKHHLELEKQNSESWESHTTCQHCYRQYMTPFQLQCHIESAHSPIESSTNCKICELAFESEQVLLEHMKGNHKPGEMPYVCQVCNYRSSFFSDVETHFRSVHENTKDLLCPFCLKVLRTSHIYMQHYMKHQKKGIHRCGKCRLNFLTYKEKVEHRAHVHKTFRKPKALEGLPPGTKVTIRASLTGKTPALPASPDRSGFIVPPEMANFNDFKSKPPVSVSKSKSTVYGAGKAKTTQSKKQEGRTSKHNLGGRFTCIECNTQVDHFFSHFPMVSNCGACKYRTSCKVAIGNHMIRCVHLDLTQYLSHFLGLVLKNSSALKLTLVCLNCDLLVDASGGDLMTKHLSDRPNHTCKVIQEKGYPKETNLKQAGSVTSGSLTAEQPESEPMLAAGDEEEKAPTETSATEGSSEGEVQQLQPDLSSSCTSDSIVGVCDESVGNSETPDVGDQLSTSVTLTEEQQTYTRLNL